MPVAWFLAFVMGSAIVGSIMWAVKTLNGAPLGPVAACIFGVLWILAMWLSYRFISTLEYKAALKYEAELAGDQFIVTGRSGKPKHLSLRKSNRFTLVVNIRYSLRLSHRENWKGKPWVSWPNLN